MHAPHDRAVLVSPLPLLSAEEAAIAGIRSSSPGWVRVRRGVRVERAGYAGLEPWRRYAVRVHAFARRHPSAVLCRESAAVLHGLPLFDEPRDIHVHDPERSSSRRFGDVCVHTSSDPRDVRRVGHVLVVDVGETVIDLARHLPPAQALAVVDAAISRAQGGTLDVPSLRDRAAQQQNPRGRRRLEWVFDAADELSESPSESVSRAVIAWCGFETPELQREFRYEGARDRVDFLFPTARVIGEADGWQKYDLADPHAAAQRLKDEKRREDRLRRNGHPFARWELRDAWRVEPLAHALRSAGVLLVRAPQPAMLATLRSREKPRMR